MEQNKEIWIQGDRPWNEYPAGTKAKALMGGYWVKIPCGRWQWPGGCSFPTPGGDATGEVCLPLLNPLPMSNNIPAELKNNIQNEAKEYAEEGHSTISVAERMAYTAGATEYAIWKVRHDDERQQRIHLEKENDILQSKYDELRADYDQLEKSAIRCNQNLQDRNDELKEENERLTVELEKKQNDTKQWCDKAIEAGRWCTELKSEHAALKAKAQRMVDALGKANLFAQEQSENAEYPNVRRRASRLSADIDTVLQDWQNKEGV